MGLLLTGKTITMPLERSLPATPTYLQTSCASDGMHCVTPCIRSGSVQIRLDPYGFFNSDTCQNSYRMYPCKRPTDVPHVHHWLGCVKLDGNRLGFISHPLQTNYIAIKQSFWPEVQGSFYALWILREYSTPRAFLLESSSSSMVTVSLYQRRFVNVTRPQASLIWVFPNISKVAFFGLAFTFIFTVTRVSNQAINPY
jgi:hypothetical protein